MKLDEVTIEKATQAGELLIRAAAVLGTLTREQQRELCEATDGNLPLSIVFPIRGARHVSKAIDESLRTHPPVGLVDCKF